MIQEEPHSEVSRQNQQKSNHKHHHRIDNYRITGNQSDTAPFMDAYVLAGHAVDSGTESQRGDQQYTLKTLRCSKSCYHMFTHGVHDAHDRSEEHTSELQ